VLTSGLAGRRPHPGGPWRLRSVEPWKASRGRSLWNSLLSGSTSSAPAWSKMGQYDGSRPHRALPADGWQALGRTCRWKRGGGRGLLYLMRQTYGTGETLTVDGGGALVW